MDFASWLRAEVERRSITHEHLAELVGVTRSAVSQWCAGLTTPRADRIAKLAEVLGVDAGDLVGRLRAADAA